MCRAFDKPAVKRIEIKNTDVTNITDLHIDDTGLGIYFERYNGRNGVTSRGPWCTTSSCPHRCGALLGKLKGGQRCYIYWRATNQAGIGHPQKSTLAISAAGRTRAVRLINTQVLYAGGYFHDALGYRYVAKYNGRIWTNIGSGPAGILFNHAIYTATHDAQGRIYVGGYFSNHAGNQYVASYDGHLWSTIGSGPVARKFDNASIMDLTFDVNGRLYAGGYFANKQDHVYVARYNGNIWSDIGSGPSASPFEFRDFIDVLAFDASGQLYVGGYFRNNSKHQYIAKYNGYSWSSIGDGPSNTPFNGSIRALVIDKSGKIYVAGDFYASRQYVAKYDDGTWTSLGHGPESCPFNSSIQSLALDAEGKLYAGGFFINKQHHEYVAQYHDGNWRSIGDGPEDNPFNGFIYALTFDAAGKLYVGGRFTNKEGHQYIASYDRHHHHWSNIGSGPGMTPFNDEIEWIKTVNLLHIKMKHPDTT